MGTLRDFSNRFWSFVSPRKTQQRRVNNEYKVKVPALPQHKKKENPESSGKRETSPTSRIKQWGAATLSLDESVSVDGAHLPPSPPKSLSPQSSPSSATSLERPYTNPEGDTLINEMQTSLNQTSGQDWDANEETFVVDAERYIEDQKSDDADLERDRRELQSRELRAAGWSEDAIFLFQKLGLRGFEPLLPYAWINDFRMLPTSLFTRNRDKAFIKPMNEAMDHHAQHALETLLDLGGHVRDAVFQKAPIRTAERVTRQAVLKYNKWALRDGGLENVWKGVSLFETVSCHKGVRGTVLQDKMIKKLGKLAHLWRLAFQERDAQDKSISADKSAAVDYGAVPELPTLYGVTTSHTLMAFVSYDPQAPDAPLRTIAIFDLGQEGYDVWNSLAIAIFISHCRNRLLQLQDSIPEPESLLTESDPDR